jgi:hypothetical protein
MRKSVAVAAVVAGMAVGASPAAAFVDKDCSDFSSWQQAEHYFKKHGGPKHDPSRLDGDHDGIPCERLR